jgi:hypothetical protein
MAHRVMADLTNLLILSIMRALPVRDRVTLPLAVDSWHISCFHALAMPCLTNERKEKMRKTYCAMVLGAANLLGLTTGGLAGDAAGLAPKTVEFLAETQISGHVQTAYVYNFQGNQGTTNPLRVFDTAPNGFMVNQFLLRLDKPLDLKTSWDAGYHVTLIGGQDAAPIKSSGLGTGTNIDLTEAFVRAQIPVGNGIEVDAGKFVTPLGAEVIDAEGNFQYSRSFLFGLAIPFTHTGLLASYNWTDGINTKFMVANGWDQVTDLNASKTFMGSIVLTAAKDGAMFFRHIPGKFAKLGGASLAITGIYGDEQAGNNHDSRWVVDVVGTYPVTEKLTLMANFDYGQEGFRGAPHGTWWGGAAYVQYHVNDTWHIGLRAEFFSDNNNDDLGGSLGGVTRTGFPGGTDLQGYTFTVVNHSWKNLQLRGEVRYDHSSESVFDGGSNGDQFTLSMDAMYMF